MKLIFPFHCREKIDQRTLNIDHIKKAIREPDHRLDVSEGRIKVRKMIGGRTIKVVYFKDSFWAKKEVYIIITAYYIEKHENNL